jgi:hypothetical protein
MLAYALIHFYYYSYSYCPCQRTQVLLVGRQFQNCTTLKDKILDLKKKLRIYSRAKLKKCRAKVLIS